MSVSDKDLLTILAEDYNARTGTNPDRTDDDAVNEWLHRNVKKSDATIVSEARVRGEDIDDDDVAEYAKKWRAKRDKKFKNDPKPTDPRRPTDPTDPRRPTDPTDPVFRSNDPNYRNDPRSTDPGYRNVSDPSTSRTEAEREAQYSARHAETPEVHE